MLVNNGLYEGKRIFKEETIEEMKKVHWRGIAPDPQYHAKGLQLVILEGYSKEPLMGHFGCAYNLRSFLLFNNEHIYVFACNGADYQGDSDHMTNCQYDILTYLIKKFEG